MPNLSPAALEVLDRLARGVRLRRAGTDWSDGAQAVPKQAVDELFKNDLIRCRGDAAVISEPGEAMLMRTRDPDHPNRAMGKCRRVETGTATKAATVNLGESPLSWLMRRKLITKRQFEAGERLRADFILAGRAPRTTMRWEQQSSSNARAVSPSVDPTIAQLSAKQRFEAASAAAGAGLTSVLWRVVCMGEGLETTERALGWPARAGKVVLGLALDRLAEFYKLPDDNQIG